MSTPRRVAVAGTLLLLALSLAVPVAAHPFVETSAPAPGESLAEGSTVVVLQFGEAIDPGSLSVRVVGPDGRDVVESVRADPLDVRTVRVTTEPLAAGSYELRWEVTSRDGHPATGTLPVAVAAAGTGDGAADPPASRSWNEIPGGVTALVGETLAGWALLVGALVTAGLAFAASVVEPGPVRRAWRATLVGSASLSVLGAGGVLVALAYRQGSLDAVVASTGGSVRLAAACVFGLSLLAAVAATRLDLWRGELVVVAGVAALGGLVVDALASHGLAGSSAMGIGAAWVMLVGLVHTAGAAVWLGGLVGLALTAWHDSAESALAAARRFSPWALRAVVAIAVSGVFYADAHLLRWADLVETRYGGLLLLKALLLVVPVSLGAYHRYRVLGSVPASGSEAVVADGGVATGPDGRLAAGRETVADVTDVARRLRRSVPLEVLALVALVSLAALLAAHPRPAHPVEAADLDRGQFHEVTTEHYRVTLVTPDPLVAGEGAAGLRVVSRALPGVSIPAPTVVADPPDGAAEEPVTATLTPDGEGQWVLDGSVLSTPGEWELTATVDGPHGPATASWTVVVDDGTDGGDTA